MSIDPDTFRQVAGPQLSVLPSKRWLPSASPLFPTTWLPSRCIRVGGSRRNVVRHGRVTAERPQIVTPYYLLSLFSGFEHGKEYAQYLAEHYGRNSPV